MAVICDEGNKLYVNPNTNFYTNFVILEAIAIAKTLNISSCIKYENDYLFVFFQNFCVCYY